MESTLNPEWQEEQPIDIRSVVKKCLRHWYWFAIGLALALAAAYIYLLHAAPVYQTDAELLIKDEKGINGGSAGGMQNDVLNQLNILAGNSNVQNEMAILSSRTIVGKVVRDLGLQTSYFIKGKVRDEELYHQTPVFIIPVYLTDSIHDIPLTVTLNSNGSYTVTGPTTTQTVQDGGSVNLPQGTLLIKKNTTGNAIGLPLNQLQAVVSPFSPVVSRFRKDLTLTQTDKTSSVIEISYKTTVPQEGVDFVNTLIREYMLAGRADKNLTAINTISFVDGRLDSVAASLQDVEKNMQQFLSENSIANIDEQSKSFIDQAGLLDQQILQQQVQTGVLEQILDYVKKPEKEYNLVPSTLGIPDPTLLGLVKNYNELQLKRLQQIQAGAGPENPLVTVMNDQLNKLRSDIKENTTNLLKGAHLASGKLQQQNQDFETKIRSVPRLQREYINIKRQQDIKQELYLYLLQKREEAGITEAANVSNSRIVDAAHTGILPIAPKKKLIWLAAFLLGLAIPGGLLYLKELLNHRIQSRQDVESLTKTPIYAEIGHFKEVGPLLVAAGAGGIVPEQFRTLRTNLSFVLGSGTPKTILITSNTEGEGKSFVSLNLAMTYAILGKRTVLVDADMRKPKLTNYLASGHPAGISAYLSGQSATDNLLISMDHGQDPFYFIGSGIIPPNPAELLLQHPTEKLMSWLKEEFDYIIIDSPPAGLVTDAQILGQYADATLFVMRHGYSSKDQINLLNEYEKGKRFPHLGIILNDIKSPEGYQYGYGRNGDKSGYYSRNGNGKTFNRLYEAIKQKIKE